jgi:hypothetical protein
MNIYFDDNPYYILRSHRVRVNYNSYVNMDINKLIPICIYERRNEFITLFGEKYFDIKMSGVYGDQYEFNIFGYLDKRDLSPTTPDTILKDQKELVKTILDLKTNIKTNDIIDIVGQYL